MDLFSFVNLLAIFPQIRFFLCKNSENLLKCARKSKSNIRNKIVSGCCNSLQRPLTSWSAPFSIIVSNASIKQENQVINLFEAALCNKHLVAAALSYFFLFSPKASCVSPKTAFLTVKYFIIFQDSNSLSTPCNTLKCGINKYIF